LCHPELVEGRGKKKFTVVWDGTDQDNQAVSSEVYFYQLRVDCVAVA